ncbi:ImmA/IrrE family metallo-endopeptidase [Thermodesulfovibrio yellowstonii]|jgi:Zn-dependent peptidase ImmA (M78 family)|uniref:DNA-binding protein n=1 Tax=Thermodesulfovibrio yellowstonii (strain ATCC 51303 / DSM 11347 / YP87) TaxID=289376 RepID=B5YKA9_THEYD|nr:ImmA/IrrE family metallo-endopeptidase [Thermodesulfovibrio yellowstonii]ACI21400.1 DNA-binding protein [Thermodesulfovibrio yellowstonii DSM 11347]MDI6865285.1 ImmA/IrrE family metallo-endopeptidase [Thermodesulfovibrio yellowstonii]
MSKIDINKEILIWAINRSGLNLDIIKKKFPKIDKWLNDEDKPTIKQAEQLAKMLYIPFGMFFTRALPEDEITIPFFRTKGEQRKLSPELIDTIHIIKQRQDWIKEYFLQTGNEPLDFVGTVSLEDDINDVSAKIKNRLGLKENWAAVFNTWQHAFNYFKEAVEEIGIFVIINGIVGNNTRRKLDVQEFRGFVITDKLAPFVFINGQDARAAQIFTLAHELVHVWLGKSAIFDLRELLPADDKTEQFCDRVAAEFLVPQNAIRDIWETYKDDEDKYQKLAKHFKVSELVIARRALDINLINKEQFLNFYKYYLNKERIKYKGGDFYLVQLQRVGKKFGQIVYLAVKEGALLYREAYKLTGLYGEIYEKFTKKLFEGKTEWIEKKLTF